MASYEEMQELSGEYAETAAGKEGATDGPDFRSLFEAAPVAHLVLRTDAPHYTIQAASDAYLRATFTSRDGPDGIVGKPLFEVFPDRPDDPDASGTRNLRASIDRAIATGVPDIMPVQHYDIQGPEGAWQERHWMPINTPVMGREGAVAYVIHSVDDVTARVIADGQRAASLERERVAVAAIDRERERTASILHSMGDAYVALDRDWRITYVNPATERINGFTAAEVIGRTHVEQWPASAGTELERMYRRAMDERIAIHMEHRYVEPGKFDTWFEVDAYPTDDGGIGIFFRDVSARKRAQEALEERELQFRTLAESIPQLAWMANAEGYLYWYNQRWYDYTGTTAEEMAGWGWQAVHDPAQLPMVVERWLDSIRTGEAFDMEFPLRRADGVFRWFLTRVVPVHDASGKVVQWFGTNTDVNERRQMEAKFRATFEQASVGICHTAPDGTWMDLNERFCEIVGYSRDELLGMTFGAITHPDDLERDQVAVAALTAGELRSYRAEKRYIRKDGAAVWTQLTSSFVRDDGSYAPDGGYLVTVVEDISERKAADQRLSEASRALEELNVELEMRAEQLQETATELEAQTEELQVTTEDLMQKTEEAQTANQAKSDFLASMSHELRTPLNAIGGYVELIEMGLRGPVTSEQATDLARIQRSQKHLLGLINDVLNFAKLGAGQVEYHTEDVTLDAALRSTEEMVLPQMRSKNIGYTYEGCDPTLMVSADREKLQQVMLNLLSNAVKFTNAGGSISVTCQVSDTFVSIRVRDTGIGIPADKLDSIFKPFVQVERKLSQPTTGAGLGLAISRDLALGMGGDLMVESAGGGSAFTLMLPRAIRI